MSPAAQLDGGGCAGMDGDGELRLQGVDRSFAKAMALSNPV